MTPQAALRLRIAGPGGTPDVLDLPPGQVTIGREKDNTLVLPHEMVSRHHAIIECTRAGKCHIVDQKSTNGTLVNEARLSPNAPMTITAGAVIAIGPFTMTVEQIPTAKPARPSPVSVEPQPPPAAPEPPGPPPPPAPSTGLSGESVGGDGEHLLPGLTLHSQRLLHYLPDIYQPPSDSADDASPAFSDTDFSPMRFISRFLALFESILLPIEWTADNFDLFLDPRTVPASFLAWLAGWLEITCDRTWTEQQQRVLLAEAHEIYARRGTRQALSRMLEIYIGQPPVITDDAENLDPYTFEVILPTSDDPVRRASIQAIIEAHKPAHTSYVIRFEPLPAA